MVVLRVEWFGSVLRTEEFSLSGENEKGKYLKEPNQLLWCTLFLHSLVRNHVMTGKCAKDCLCLSHTALLICRACWGFVSGIFHSLKCSLQDALN